MLDDYVQFHPYLTFYHCPSGLRQWTFSKSTQCKILGCWLCLRRFINLQLFVPILQDERNEKVSQYPSFLCMKHFLSVSHILDGIHLHFVLLLNGNTLGNCKLTNLVTLQEQARNIVQYLLLSHAISGVKPSHLECIQTICVTLCTKLKTLWLSSMWTFSNSTDTRSARFQGVGFQIAMSQEVHKPSTLHY